MFTETNNNGIVSCFLLLLCCVVNTQVYVKIENHIYMFKPRTMIPGILNVNVGRCA